MIFNNPGYKVHSTLCVFTFILELFMLNMFIRNPNSISLDSLRCSHVDIITQHYMFITR